MATDAGRTWLERLRDPRTEIGLPLFAHHTVPRGWTSSQPGIPEHLLYLMAQNACEALIDGRTVRLDAGALLWIRPGVPFRFRLLQSDRPVELYRYRLTVGSSDHLAGGLPFAGSFAVWRKAWEVRPYFESLLMELHTRRAYRDERLRALLILFFSTLFRMNNEAASESPGLRSSICERLQRLVASSAGRRLTPVELADEAGLSPDYFSRLFRATYGMAPRKWLVSERLRWAAQRLAESDIAVGTLASQLGYPDIFSFSRQFKQVHGVGPRAYRERSRR